MNILEIVGFVSLLILGVFALLWALGIIEFGIDRGDRP